MKRSKIEQHDNPTEYEWIECFSEHQSTGSKSENTFKCVVGCSPDVCNYVWKKYIAPHNMNKVYCQEKFHCIYLCINVYRKMRINLQ